jgi:nicotinate-nucleotide adenylyltransferase
VKTGVFGGTFNPPHLGHLIVAEFVRDHLGLERVFFIPTAVPPHKKDLDIVEAHHRLAMLEHALQGNRRMIVSDLEIQRGGLSFTADTLAEFRRLRPEDQLFLLIGMDNYLEFHTWKSPEVILELSTLVVMRRPGIDGPVDTEVISTNTIFCEVPEIGIASRDIRTRVEEGKSIRYLVPAAVERYIIKHELYRRQVE